MNVTGTRRRPVCLLPTVAVPSGAVQIARPAARHAIGTPLRSGDDRYPADSGVTSPARSSG